MNKEKESLLKLPLDAIILVPLIFAYIIYLHALRETYIDQLSSIYFLSLCIAFIYIYVSFSNWSIITRSIRFIKGFLLALLVLVLVISPILAFIADREGVNKGKNYHDGAIQVEIAYDMVLRGENPYVENYYGTELERFQPTILGDELTIENPAVEHLIYLPGVLGIVGVAGSIEEALIGFQDIRIIMLIMYVVSIIFIFFLTQKSQFQYFAVSAFAFNPIFLSWMAEARNDMLVLFLIIASLFLFQKKKIVFSGLVFGLALATKQFAWFLFPLFVLYFLAQKQIFSFKSIGFKFIVTSCVVVALLVLPFLFWDSGAFVDDILLFASGSSSSQNYPADGFGITGALQSINPQGEIDFPFWIISAIIGIAIYYNFYLRMRRHPLVSDVVLGATLVMFGSFLFAHVFHSNYVALISQLFIVWLAMRVSEEGVVT